MTRRVGGGMMKVLGVARGNKAVSGLMVSILAFTKLC